MHFLLMAIDPSELYSQGSKVQDAVNGVLYTSVFYLLTFAYVVILFHW
jgi:hypothetical protein